MSDPDWQSFFLVCADFLGAGSARAAHSNSWCAWTTFRRLNEDAGYWTSGLPNRHDIADSYIKDGGVWGQPFLYSDLAHIIVPRQFCWQTEPGAAFSSGTRRQDLDGLSSKLSKAGIDHRLTSLVLEIKLF